MLCFFETIKKYKRNIISMMVMSIIVTIFCVPIVQAYYQINKSQNVGFTIRGYSALATSLDKSGRYASCNNSATVKLTVTNPNAYAVSYKLAFSNTNVSYVIDGAAGATYTVAANSSKTHTIGITGSTGTSITVSVNAEFPYTVTSSQVVNFDNSCPTGSISSTKNTAASQTATLTIKDNIGAVAYYFGTSNTPADSAYTTITSTTSTSVNKTVNAAGTYYLKIKDAAGNVSSTSATFYKVSLNMANGTVNPTSIVAKSGDAVALPTPTASTGYTNVGNWYKENTYATNVGAYGANYTVSSTTTIYSHATDVTEPTITNTAKSNNVAYNGEWTKYNVNVTLNFSDNGSGIDASSLAWGTNGTTWTSITNTNTSTYSDTWSAQRNSTGYYKICDLAGNCKTTSLVIKIDKTSPTMSLSANSDSSYSKTKTVTVTINDTGGSGLASGASVKYGWSTSTTTEPTSYTNATLSYTAGTNSTTFTANGSGLTGEYYLWVVPTTLEDVATNADTTILKSTGTFKFDNTAPSVSDIGGGTTLKATSQSLILKCSDTVEVTAYYFGTTNPTSASAVSSTTAANITSLTSTNGWTQNVNEAGTYYLACKDAAGNYAKKSITIVSYSVNNLLETIAGTTNTYTSANYTSATSGTYVVKSGTSLTLASTYTIPTGSNASNFKGYSTSYGTSAATLSTSAPTVASGTTYYMWFNRITYTITVTKPTNGSIKAETVTKTGNSITVTSSSSTNTLTAKYGDTVKGTATANSGYRFSEWSGGYLSGTTNPSTGVAITAAKTIAGTFDANMVTINLKNGTAASTKGYSVSLSTSNSSDSATKTATNSNGTVTFSPIANGTYYIWSGKNSNATSTRIYSGVSVTVNNNSPSQTVQYYALILATGNGISAVSNAGTSTTGAVEHLYNSSSVQNIAIDATVKSGYTWSTWSKTSGTTLATITVGTKSQNVKMGAGAATYTANATYTATPTITRNDLNTFTVSATGGSQYIISKTQTSAPTASTSGWATTTSAEVSTSAKETWYVWVKDAAGNVSPNSATITNYKVTLTAGTGTTLTAKADTTNGTSVTSGSYVLSGTPVYPTGALKTGYNTLVVKKGSTTITNGSSQSVTADTTFTSSATANVYTVKYDCGAGTKPSGTLGDQTVSYGSSITIASANTCTRAGYTHTKWADPTGDSSLTGWSGTWSYVDGQYGITNKVLTLTAQYTYVATPTITRSDLNTFTVSATSGLQYIISKTQTSAPTASTSGWATTTSKEVSTSAKETWYVWVKDAAGNVSPNSATITNYKVTLTAGTGTTLTAKADTTNGTSVTSGSYVLSGTPVYPTGALKTGYNTLVVKKGSTTITNGSSQSVTADTTFTSSATANVYTVKYDCGAGTKPSGTLGDQTVSYGSSITIASANTCTRAGYTHTKWYDPTGDNGWTGWSGTWSYVDGQYGITNKVLTLTAQYSDTTAPAPTISGGTSAKQTSQTFNLSCTDGVGVTGYYWGTTEPTSSTTFTSVTSTTSWSSTGSANSATTYWLGCKDAAGNIGKTSVVVRSLTVHNMLLNIAGTETSYNTSHYTQSNAPVYYVASGTSFTQANMCTTPTGGNTLKGYNEAAPSTSTATLKTSNLTISANKEISCWYNRITYTVTITKPTNGSIKAETVSQGSNSITVTSSSSTNTLTVRYGDTVKGTATANSGYSFTGWSGGYLSGTTNPSTGAAVTAAKTIAGAFTDSTAPTLSFSPNSSSTYAKTASVTVTVADAGSKVKANQTIKYRWQTSSTCSTTASDYTSSATLSNTSAAAASATATATASGYTGAEYYLCVYSGIQDVAGNTSVISKSGKFMFDNTSPSNCTWGSWNEPYIKSGATATITLTCADANSGITMDLSTSDVTVSGTNLGTITNIIKGGSNTSRTYTFTLTGGSASGTPTLTIAANKIQDVAGNKFATAKTSGSIIVDVAAPTLAVSVSNGTTYAKSKSATVTIADTGGSGLAATAQTIRYVWSTSNVTTCNSTSMPNTISITPTAGSNSATGTITIDSGTGAGKLYICNAAAISDRASNSLAASQIKSADMYLDNTAPSSCNWGNWSSSYIKSGATATITLTCADANSGITMDLATSDVTVSGTNLGTVTNVTKGGSNTSRTYTFTLTGGSASGTPTLTIAANKVQDVAGNKFATAKTSGSIIVDVAAPTLAVSVSNGTTYAKSKSATVTIADTGGSGLAATAQTIRYVWSTSNVTTCNATSMPNTISITPTAGSNSATGTITIDSGTGAGKLYICNAAAISDRASNSLAASTIKSADMYLDNTAPSSCNWGNWSTSYIKSGGTATITLTCADANSGITMDLSTSDVTVSGTNLGSVTAVSKGGSNASRTYTFTLTGGSASGSPTLTIAANKIQDVAGNKFATAKTSGSIIVDAAAPTLAVSVSSGTTYAKSKSATVTIADTGGSGLAATAQTIRYVWSTSNVTTCNATSMPNTISITPTAGSNSATGTITVSSGTGAGKLYICNAAAISDRASNSLAASTIKSADMYLDNTAPSSCNWGNWSTSYIKSGGTATITLTCADANSGITMDLAASDVTVSGTNLGTVTNVTKGGSNTSRTYTFTLTGGSASGTPTLTIAANKVQDVAGNKFATAKTSGSIIVDNTSPTISVSGSTTYATSRSATITIADTGGSGLTAGTYTIKYAWGTSAVACANMSHSTTITATAGASSATGTVTIADETGAGKIYICNDTAITDRAGNSLAASSTANNNMYLDNDGPSCTWGSWNKSYIKSNGTATITLTCTDSHSGVTMDLATSDIIVGGTNSGSLTAVTKGGSNASRTYTFTFTGGAVTGTPTLTLSSDQLHDTLNNYSESVTSGEIIVDNDPPIITLADSIVYIASGTNVDLTTYGTATDSGGSGLNSFTSNITNASSLALGQHELTFTATDNVGNSASSSLTLIIYTLITCDTTGMNVDPTNSSRCIFRGANPDNYILFNATYDGFTASGGTLFRIIGSESNGALKIVKATSLTNLKLHSSASYTWGSSTLRTYLNTNTSGNYYYTLNEIAKNHIQPTKFNIGTMSYYNSSNTIAQTVTAETGTKESANSYVGIPNVFDHLLASSNCTSTTKWTQIGTKSNGTFTCDKDNWMVYTTSAAEEWFITKHNDTRARRWLSPGCGSSGCSSSNDKSIQYANPTESKNIRPVIYIQPNIKIIGGTGTSSDPYILEPMATSPATCTVTTTSGYDTSKTLTITATLNGATLSSNPYSWVSATSGFGTDNTQVVSAAGTYTAYIKDSEGRINKCSLAIKSRTEYQHSTCSSAKSCTYCSESGYVLYSGYCYGGLNSSYGNSDECEEMGHYWVKSKCYNVRHNSSSGSNLSHCGCKTWNTSDETWYTNTCGTSNYSSCKNRNTRITIGP